MPARTMDALQKRLQTSAEDFVIVRAAKPALGSKLHVFDAARRTGQTGELIRERPNVLAYERLQDGRQIQLLLLDKLLLFGTSLTQVQLLLGALDDVGQVHRGRVVAALTFHAAVPFSGPCRRSSQRVSAFFKLADAVAESGRILIRLAGDCLLELFSQLQQFRLRLLVLGQPARCLSTMARLAV